MCEIFAYSSSEATRATFDMETFRQHGCGTGPHCDGWGLAFYTGPYAQIFRDVKPAAYSDWMSFILDHNIETQCLISHIRKATQGSVNLQNTQPFSREWAGHRHVFAHNGNLQNLEQLGVPERFQPIGDTDSERAFCQLMDSISDTEASGAPTDLDARLARMVACFGQWAQMGPANIAYSDSEYLYVFANKRTQVNGSIEPPGLHMLQRNDTDNHTTKLTGVELKGQSKFITLFASVPLSNEAWVPLKELELIVCQNGRVVRQLQL